MTRCSRRSARGSSRAADRGQLQPGSRSSATARTLLAEGGLRLAARCRTRSSRTRHTSRRWPASYASSRRMRKRLAPRARPGLCQEANLAREVSHASDPGDRRQRPRRQQHLPSARPARRARARDDACQRRSGAARRDSTSRSCTATSSTRRRRGPRRRGLRPRVPHRGRLPHVGDGIRSTTSSVRASTARAT